MTTDGAPGVRPRTALGPGGEFDLIRSFLVDGEPGPEVRIGPGDDALVLEGGVVVSTDLMVEDVHFRRDWISLREVGRRAAAAALSDLAAMAAEPTGVLVSLAVAGGEAADAGPTVHRGIRDVLEAVGGSILGGDLSASPGPLVLDVVAVGRTGRPLLRSGARPGDEVWVTGRLGGAAAAVSAWSGGGAPGDAARRAFAEPTPRIREALWLSRQARIRALIDVSDGLVGDAGHVAAASGVAIVLDADAVPIHEGSEGGPVEGARERALRGGEDYELLLVAEADSIGPLVQDFELRFGVPLTRVGEVVEGTGVRVRSGGEVRPVEPGDGGFDHFAGEPPDPESPR